MSSLAGRGTHHLQTDDSNLSDASLVMHVKSIRGVVRFCRKSVFGDRADSFQIWLGANPCPHVVFGGSILGSYPEGGQLAAFFRVNGFGDIFVEREVPSEFGYPRSPDKPEDS